MVSLRGSASAYDRRTFLAIVLDPTDIYLANLDGSPFNCRYSQILSGTGQENYFTVTDGMGHLSRRDQPRRLGRLACHDERRHGRRRHARYRRGILSQGAAPGKTYTAIVSLNGIVPGTAGITTGPLCSKVYVEGAYAADVKAIARGKPCVVTFASHHFVPGDLVEAASIGGMTELNGNFYTVACVDGNAVILHAPGGSPIDSSTYGAFSSGGQFSAVAQGFPSYVTATLDNIIDEAHHHVLAYYPVRGRFSRLQGFRTRAPLCVIGDAYCEYDKVVIGGIWDEDRPGLQETVAGIYMPTAELNLRTLPTIKAPGLISSGTASAPRLVRRGNAALVQKKDTGCRDGIYCEQAEGFELSGGYLGGHNRSMVRFKAMSILVHVNIHDMFMDGSGEYGIHLELGTSASWNVTILDINANGGDVSDGLVMVDDGTGVLPIPHVNSMNIHNCVGQGYRSAPISLLGVVGAEIDANELNGYNQFNDTSGGPTLSSGVYIGPHSSLANLTGGTYGGGINMTVGPNNCRWSV